MADRTVVSLIDGEFQRYKALGEGALAQLDDDQVTARSGSDSSVATMIWHVAGNLASRFTDFLTEDGEKPWRDREGEFQTRQATQEELRQRWDQGWSVLLATLGELRDEDLSREVRIRSVALRVDEALLRSLAHVSYHVGQIVYVSKSQRGDAWRSLSIPPGQSAAYNENPNLEKPPGHSQELDRRSGT